MSLRGHPQRQDDGDDEGRQLIGVGAGVKSRGREAFKELLQKHIIRAKHPMYFALSSKLPNVLMHKQADLPGVGTVNAQAYDRAVSRVSYFVQIEADPASAGRVCWLQRFKICARSALCRACQMGRSCAGHYAYALSISPSQA